MNIAAPRRHLLQRGSAASVARTATAVRAPCTATKVRAKPRGRGAGTWGPAPRLRLGRLKSREYSCPTVRHSRQTLGLNGDIAALPILRNEQSVTGPLHAMDVRSGVALLDRVVFTVLERDQDALQDLLGFQEIACVVSSDAGGPPHCPANVPEGPCWRSFRSLPIRQLGSSEKMPSESRIGSRCATLPI